MPPTSRRDVIHGVAAQRNAALQEDEEEVQDEGTAGNAGESLSGVALIKKIMAHQDRLAELSGRPELAAWRSKKSKEAVKMKKLKEQTAEPAADSQLVKHIKAALLGVAGPPKAYNTKVKKTLAQLRGHLLYRARCCAAKRDAVGKVSKGLDGLEARMDVLWHSAAHMRGVTILPHRKYV